MRFIPHHQVRPAGCWAPKDQAVAITPSSGRDRVNIHGAIDLETGKTQMLDVPTVDAQSTILLLIAILAAHPSMRMIHIFLDNARYHHARLVSEWLAREGGRITLHFVPTYSPHLNPIERLWGAMHRNVTHNRSYASFRDFKAATMAFLTHTVPKNWTELCDQVSDNLRVIDPANFRIMA